jgi:L-histidine N-alpha-methyltransferase
MSDETRDRWTPEDTKALYREVVRGLRRSPRRLPHVLWLDPLSGLLAAELARTEEHYLIRSEWQVLRRHAREIAQRLYRPWHLVELGCGEGLCAEVLVQTLHPHDVTPVDSSPTLLASASRRMGSQRVRVHPLRVPSPLELDVHGSDRGLVVHISAAALGAMPRHEVNYLLERLVTMIEGNGALLVGFDRTCDPELATRAFADRAGCCDRLNRRAIARLHELFGWPIDPKDFTHGAGYDPELHRVVQTLHCKRPMVIPIHNTSLTIPTGAAIETAHHHLYRIKDIGHMARSAGLDIEQLFIDDHHRCCVALMRVHRHEANPVQVAAAA